MSKKQSVVYKGLQFRNEGEKTVEIDVEGVIGGSFWWEDDDPNSKNTKEKMKAELKRIANLKADTIIVNINSYGGDVNHGLSIHDLLAEHEAKIITKINGMTASAATIIAAAGDERKISDNSLFLAHRASLIAFGNINDINMAADDLKKVDDRIINIYVKITGKSKEEITEVMDRNNGYGEWITPDEAKKIGFVTEIFEPKKMAAYFPNELLSKFHLPPVPEDKLNEEEETADNSSLKQNKFFQKILDKLDKIMPIGVQTQIQNKAMKIFNLLNKVLGVESLESTDDKGVYLSEKQLEKIEAALKAAEDAEKAKTDAVTAQQTAEKALKDAETVLDIIDDTVKDAKGIDKKVEAVKAKFTEKPAQQPAGAEGKEDPIQANDVDTETINNLPHNKEADANGY